MSPEEIIELVKQRLDVANQQFYAEMAEWMEKDAQWYAYVRGHTTTEDPSVKELEHILSLESPK